MWAAQCRRQGGNIILNYCFNAITQGYILLLFTGCASAFPVNNEMEVIEQLYYNYRYEQVIEQVQSIRGEQRDDESDNLMVWRAVIYQCRSHYQLRTAFAPFAPTSQLDRFGRAYTLMLDDENAADALPKLVELAEQLPANPLVLAARWSAELKAHPEQHAKLLPHFQELVKKFPSLPESHEAIFFFGTSTNDYALARNAGREYPRLMRETRGSQLGANLEKVRVASTLFLLDQPREAEKELAELLDGPDLPLTGRAMAYYFLATIAFHEAVSANPAQHDFRNFSMEVAHRFARRALDLTGQGRGRTIEQLRANIENFLRAGYNVSGEYPVYSATRPREDESDPRAWLDYATAAMLAGNAREEFDATRRAYYLSLEQKKTVLALQSLRNLLPKQLRFLSESDAESLLADWQKAMDSNQSHFIRQRLLAFSALTKKHYAEAAEALAFILEPEGQQGVNREELRDAAYDLGVYSYWAGRYEAAARAWNLALEVAEAPSVRAAIEGNLRLDKVQPFSGAADKPNEALPRTLAEAVTRLETALTDDSRPLVLLNHAVDLNRFIQKAEPHALATMSMRDFEYIRRAHQRLEEQMAPGSDWLPYLAGLIKAVSRIDYLNIFPEQRQEIRNFWVEQLQNLQGHAEQGDFQARLLPFDVELYTAELIEDFRHVARSAAGLAQTYLDAGNVDIAPFLTRIQSAFERTGRKGEAALYAVLVIEAQQQARLEMNASKSRREFFNDRFGEINGATLLFEELLALEVVEEPLRGFLSSLYWDIVEGTKVRYLLDQELVESVPAEFLDTREKQFLAIAKASLEPLLAQNPEFPVFSDLFGRWQKVLSEIKTPDLSALPLRSPLRASQLSLDELQQLLPPGTGVLVIAARPRYQDDHGALLFIQHDDIAYATLAPFRYEQDILRPLLKNAGAPAKENREALRFLFDAVLGPFREQLSEVEHLVISPAGPFNSVPWATLWDSKTSTHLVQSHTVTVLPSSKLLAWATETTPPVSPVSRVLYAYNTEGNPEGWIMQDWMRRGSSEEEARGLTNLREIKKEYMLEEKSFLRAQWGDQLTVLEPSNLTKTSLQQMLSSAQIAHLSMHGLVRGRGADDSLLLLPFEENRPVLFRPGDLQALDLTAMRVAVLSSCELGQAYVLSEAKREGSGEVRWFERLAEFEGFPLTFLSRGARALVAPVATIHAGDANDFFDKFHGYLRQGDDSAVALAKAQRDILKDDPDGRLSRWGLFVHFGAAFHENGKMEAMGN